MNKLLSAVILSVFLLMHGIPAAHAQTAAPQTTTVKHTRHKHKSGSKVASAKSKGHHRHSRRHSEGSGAAATSSAAGGGSQ